MPTVVACSQATEERVYMPDLAVIAAGQGTSAYLTFGLLAPLNQVVYHWQAATNAGLLPKAAVHMSVTQDMLSLQVVRKPP